MSDDMIDLAAGDARLRRRLEAYAEDRLSPDKTATSRMRARVLAHAHRQADLARADAALSIVPPASAVAAFAPRHRRAARRTALALVAAAALAGALVGGAAASSGPGEALYDARLWVETVTLPSDPSERALAELDRLAQRLHEADEAARAGDTVAAAAALAAYERIMAEASAMVLAAGDPVAAAALETGVGRNLEILQALLGRVPTPASEAISRAVDRAIERSATAIDKVDKVKDPKPAGTGGAGGPAATPKPTKAPDVRPTPKPTKVPVRATPAPAPTPDKPDKTAKPTHERGPSEPRGNQPD
jgi:hypothetical protein